MKLRTSVGIIGYGRFGKVLADLLKKQFSLKIYDLHNKVDTLEDVLKTGTVFIAVPIREFEKVIRQISFSMPWGTTIIDVCSVKLYPAEIMKKYLPPYINIIATHPLFGPDSIEEKNKLKIMMHKIRDEAENYVFWKEFFSEKGFTVLEMTPDEHDQFAAQSQALTHFVGRCLEAIHTPSTPLNTSSYEKLLEVVNVTCNDSPALFEDLLRYNPYSQKTVESFLEAAVRLSKASLFDRSQSSC